MTDKALYILAGYDGETEKMLIDTPDMTLKAIPVVLSEFSSFRGRITTLYLYEFWPTRHILTVKLTAAEG